MRMQLQKHVLVGKWINKEEGDFMVHVFVCMVCTLIFSVNAMEKDESQLLLANIQEMQLYHQSHDQSGVKSQKQTVLTKFERVLHLPIQPTEKQTQYIAIAMETLTKHN